MNIDEIRTLINEINSAKVFCVSQGLTKPESDSSWFQTAARIIIDLVYKAGKEESITVPDKAAIIKAENKGFDYGLNYGFDKAAKDPKAWYVLDKNGERVHIGDIINSQSYRDVKVIGFQNGACGIGVVWSDLTIGHNISATADSIEKVIPDTREKIKEEMANNFIFTRIENEEARFNLAEQFISRIEALDK